MANSGIRPNSASSSSRFERLPHYSEASSWPGSLRCLRQESCACQNPNSRYLPTVLAGSPCSTASALVLYAKRPFGGPKQVLSYLANYTHRVALSNRRIVAVDAQHQSVTFTYRDYRHGSQLKELTLSALEFIRRFSLHILPPGLVRIRHYGILGNNRRRAAIAEELLSQKSCYRRRAAIAEELLSQQPARSSSAAGAPWSFSRRTLRKNRRVVRCAEKPEFVWWPLPMPPAFCT